MPSPPSPSPGMQRQLEIYLAGARGGKPQRPLAYADLRRAAREQLEPQAFDYLDGGAGAGQTMRANRRAFRRQRIVPRMLRGVDRAELSVELLGQTLAAPLLLAPIGVQSILHPDAELAVARAAAATGTALVLSTAASRTLEDVARAAAPAPTWFQLYWSKDRDFAASLLQRAAAAGYGALVVTLDTTQMAWRERDLQHGYLPFLHGEGLANYFSDPVFRAALSRPPEEDPEAAIRHFAAIFADARMTWDDLPFLRQHWQRPILLKGILHPDDAREALQRGVDGLIVSNHGGRQMDGAVGALDALEPVVAAVAGRAPVLFDSGVRRAADAVKALALGARAVLLGRPYAMGLAVGGETGVREVLLDFLADLDLTLALAGCRTPADVGPELLAPR